MLGVNLVMGYAGQISLGHAGFAAIGAYATALLVVNYEISFWLALALGGFLAAAFGYLLGVPALRLGPLYVSMVTFGFGLVVVIILQNWYDARKRSERDDRSPARAVRIRALPATVSRSDCPDRRRAFSARPQHRQFTTRTGVYRHSGE